MTEGEIRAAARGIYEEYDSMGAGYTISWGAMPEHERTRYLQIAKAALEAVEKHRAGKFNG
jgi:hypothetical protein